MTPHHFQGISEGISDRGCTVPGCGLPDRDPVHRVADYSETDETAMFLKREDAEPGAPGPIAGYTCQAEVCKRATDGGTEEFRAILSDSDHVMLGGCHYHLHCAPSPFPAVKSPLEKVADWAPPDPSNPIDFLIERINNVVEEAPQAEREPLLYRAHVLGVLHQAKAMERIADYLGSLDITADRIFNEVLKPGGEPHEFMLPHTGGGKDCYVCGMPKEAHGTHGARGPICYFCARGEHESCAAADYRASNPGLALLVCSCSCEARIVQRTAAGEMSDMAREIIREEESRSATGPDAEPDPAEGMRRMEGGE